MHLPCWSHAPMPLLKLQSRRSSSSTTSKKMDTISCKCCAAGCRVVSNWTIIFPQQLDTRHPMDRSVMKLEHWRTHRQPKTTPTTKLSTSSARTNSHRPKVSWRLLSLKVASQFFVFACRQDVPRRVHQRSERIPAKGQHRQLSSKHLQSKKNQLHQVK